MPSRELAPSADGLTSAPTPGTPNGLSSNGTLKKHKQLPHPRRNGSSDYSTPASSQATSSSASRGLSLETDITTPSAASATSINASPRTLKHTARRIIGSIDLPPTPPAHSRNSSNDTSLPLSVKPVTNGDLVESPTCSTPINVQSPPTPDFTPPRPRRVDAMQVKGLGGQEKRREMGSRNDSMNTTTSFVTAKEELESDQDDSTIRPNHETEQPVDVMDYMLDEDRLLPQPQGPPKMKSLGLGLEDLEDAFARHATSTTDSTPLKKKFSFEDNFDAEFVPDTPTRDARGVADINPILSRNVTITRGKPRRKPYNFDNNESPAKPPKREHTRRYTEQEVALRDEVTVKTPNAIRHIQAHGFADAEEFGRIEVETTPRQSRQEDEMARTHRRSHTQPEKLSVLPKARHAPVADDLHDVRKFSHSSQRSNSTVEAMVMVQPQQLKTRRTLRHKERMGSLRDFSPSSASTLRQGHDGNGVVREPTQRLRHKSVDLPVRIMEDRRVGERPRRREEVYPGDRPREKKKMEEHAPSSRSRELDDLEPAQTHSRNVSDQTIVPARSRQVSEQTVIEHPRKSPLPAPPREEVIVLQPPSPQPEPDLPRKVDQDKLQARPPVTLQDQPPKPARRYSIERKPVPIRQRIDSTASASTAKTTDTAKSRSRKALSAEGVIPVVIVPRRTSSLKEQSQPPSLRSTSTTRNSKAPSVAVSRSSSTAPMSASAGANIPGAWPESAAQSIRQRGNSDGGSVVSGKGVLPKEDGLVRSVEHGPPAIPVRRSSMSAPTTPMGSRNVSRSTSLTAESLRAHNQAEALAAISVVEPTNRTVSQTIQQRRDENRDSGVGYGVGINLNPNQSVRIEEPLVDEEERASRKRNTYLSVDTNGDPLFGDSVAAQVTPFSVKSDVTGTSRVSHGTALEVAEARQVDIFSHQNTSVQLVDQEPPSSSASESIKLRQKSIARSGGRPGTSSSAGAGAASGTVTSPKLQMGEKYSSASLTNSNGKPNNFTLNGTANPKFQQDLTPASPPQSQGAHFDSTAVGGDSPLINPRQPPAPPAGPPAFKIIPPTPAAQAAAEEATKQLGWEAPLDVNGEVSRPPRRGWSLRGIGGGLVRSLSLTRRGGERRRRTQRVDDIDVGGNIGAPVIDDEVPADSTKLHPFWKPANYRDEDDEECDCDECWARIEEEARGTKRGGRAFNGNADGQGRAQPQRPGMPRRSSSQMSALSKRMKKTFAIMPLAGVDAASALEDDGYNVSYATARRTIKRSGSGNLKVVKRVGNVSKESLKLQEYLNLPNRRDRRWRRNGRRGAAAQAPATGGDGADEAMDTDAQERPQTPPPQSQRKRFSWVGGSTDSPASKYPPVVRYPVVPNEGVFDNGAPPLAAPLKRTFSLPTPKGSVPFTVSFPPRVNVEWLGLGGLGGLGRRFSERASSAGASEKKREGLKRTISAPRGVRDGVEDVLSRRQREEARRDRFAREQGVEREDFAR